MKKKLAIISTHPIQYNAPFFRLLNERGNVQVKVFYSWGESALQEKYDPGFKKVISWDIPLLEGYEYEFAENTAREKGSHHFQGIINPTLIGRIEEFNPDALLVYGWSFHGHLKVMRHFKGRLPVIFRGDSTLLDKQPIYKKWVRNLFLRWIYLHIDLALYVGKNNYEYYKSVGLREKQLIYAPHVVDNKRFSEPDAVYEQAALLLRGKLSIPEESVVFLFAGKLEDKKDPVTLLQAFAGAGSSGKEHLVIVGNGDLEQDLKKSYAQLPTIHFMDFQNQSEMPVIYRVGDVFVLPSRGPGETWGLAVNEAMACGRPVLVSDRCGCSTDLVSPAGNGYIFKAGEVGDLEAKIKLMSHKPDLNKMGASSRQKINDFSFTKVCQPLEDLILGKNERSC